MMRVTVAPAAVFEMADAVRSYELTRPGLGADFARELDYTLRHVAGYPDYAAAIAPGYRRAIMHRFPYGVVYRMRDGDVQVLALFPTRADPARLQDRLAAVSQ